MTAGSGSDARLGGGGDRADAGGAGAPASVPVSSALSSTARRWWLAVVAVVGLLTLYDLVEAVSNLVGVVTQVNAYNEFADANGLAIAAIPWVLLVLTLLVPPVAFVVALRLARRMPLGVRALVLVTGLATSAALTLSLAAFA